MLMKNNKSKRTLEDEEEGEKEIKKDGNDVDEKQQEKKENSDL